MNEEKKDQSLSGASVTGAKSMRQSLSFEKGFLRRGGIAQNCKNKRLYRTGLARLALDPFCFFPTFRMRARTLTPIAIGLLLLLTACSANVGTGGDQGSSSSDSSVSADLGASVSSDAGSGSVASVEASSVAAVASSAAPSAQ